MKPDTEELDLALGRQLVEIGRSYRPTPPDDLVRFIDGVPTARRRSRWSRTFGRHATLVRGTLLAAAALLVAAVATTAIVNVRNNQDAATAQGWSWHAVSGSQVRFGYLRTPGGYLANCSSNTGEATPCSSRDGVNWTSGLDPSVVSIDGTSSERVPFGSIQKVGDIYLAFMFMGGSPTGLMRSTDGIHWHPVDAPAVQPAYEAANYLYLTTVGGQFAYVLGQATPEGGGLFVSPDGLQWTQASALPAQPSGEFGSGVAGLYMATSDEPAKYWRTLDGVKWARVETPGIPVLAGILPDGTYLAQSYGDVAPIASADGMTWGEVGFDLPNQVEALVVVDGRILAEAGPGAAGDASSPIWESIDSGKSWHALLGPDGRQLHGAPVVVGDAVFILQGSLNDRHVGYVGFFDGRSIASAPPATPAPTPIPTPTSRPVPTRLPASAQSEWTWQQFDNHKFEGPIRVPGGWVATCSTSAPGTNDFGSASLCSSSDGLHWQIPADSAMVAPDGTDFWPLVAIQANGVYLAYSLQHWIPFDGEGIGSIWRSTDGHAWTKLPDSTFGGRKLLPTPGLELFNGRFATIASSPDGTTSMLVSTDGLTWTSLGDLPAAPNSWAVTGLGILLDTNLGSRTAAGNWLSRDGVTWSHVSLPQGVTDVGGDPVKLADGSYIDIGWDFASDGKDASTLMTSTDGLSWKALTSKPEGTVMSLGSIGGRLILNMALGQNNEGPYAIWQSSNGGKTWQSLPDPEGFPATGFIGRFGDGVVVTTTTDIPTRWLGTLNSK